MPGIRHPLFVIRGWLRGALLYYSQSGLVYRYRQYPARMASIPDHFYFTIQMKGFCNIKNDC